MNHKEAGINKGVSEAVYSADILSDKELRMCGLLARGAWYECLFNMWHDKTDRITATRTTLARLWGCTKADVDACLSELRETKACDVTVHNEKVTLISRRLNRRMKVREKAALRAQKHRDKQGEGEVGDESNGVVTEPDPLPSSPPSSSPTSSITKKNNWLIPFAGIWASKFGAFPYGQAGKSLKPLEASEDMGVVLAAFERYCETTDAAYVSVTKFAQTWKTYMPVRTEDF